MSTRIGYAPYEVGWHLAESLRAMQRHCFWSGRYANWAGQSEDPEDDLIKRKLLLASAGALGYAYGHAFRAAELAYDQATREKVLEFHNGHE